MQFDFFFSPLFPLLSANLSRSSALPSICRTEDTGVESIFFWFPFSFDHLALALLAIYREGLTLTFGA
jgi:hypothetical protein